MRASARTRDRNGARYMIAGAEESPLFLAQREEEEEEEEEESSTRNAISNNRRM